MQVAGAQHAHQLVHVVAIGRKHRRAADPRRQRLARPRVQPLHGHQNDENAMALPEAPSRRRAIAEM